MQKSHGKYKRKKNGIEQINEQRKDEEKRRKKIEKWTKERQKMQKSEKKIIIK